MLNATGNNVIVEPDKAPEVSQGGILIPDQARKKSTQGVVVSVGPGRTNHDNGSVVVIPIGLQVGDRVMYGEWDGAAIEHEGKSLVVLNADSVLAKLVE